MSEYKEWKCRRCGHEVYAIDRPAEIQRMDGHICVFYEVKNDF